MLVCCNVHTTEATAGLSNTCMDVDMLFEDEPDGSVLFADAHHAADNGTAPCGKDCVLDICFCSECVSSAFTDDAGTCEQHGQTSHSELALVSAAGAHTAKIAATCVPTSPRRIGVSSLMPAPGAEVPQKGLSDAQQAVTIDECKQKNREHARSSRIDERKQKNRDHARSSRIRKKNELNIMQQNEAELRAECARLRVVLQELEHEQKNLKTNLLVDVFLC